MNYVDTDDDDAVFQFDRSAPLVTTEPALEKGKSLSLPVPIPNTPLFDKACDIFDLSFNTDLTFVPSSSSSSLHTESSPFLTSEQQLDGYRSSQKGKEREIVPSLPPLEFMPRDLTDNPWPSPSFLSSTPGPSSYTSSFYGSPRVDNESSFEPSNGTATPQRVPSRSRSFSTASMGLPPGQQDATQQPDCIVLKIESNDGHELSAPMGPLSDANDLPCLPPKAKPRSNSSPYPLSTSDLLLDTCAQLPLLIDAFDNILPIELRLHILRTLLLVHEEDHVKVQADGNWSLSKACSSKNKWVGRYRGIRELVKLSRVSKTWQLLVFDGQLWEEVDLRAFPMASQTLPLRVSGPCVTSLNVAGHVCLSPSTMFEITEKLCVPMIPRTTQLVSLNLRGCTALTTRSLHGILMCSSSLRQLVLKGLSVVTNTTCEILASHCLELVSLDLSRCRNMDADGVKSLTASAVGRHEHLPLKVLRLSGLKLIDDDTMACLARAAPFLETLDLSYAHHLHNSAVEAFVACDEAEDEASLGVPTIILNAREAGRETNDSGRYKRRRTWLRHLSLSSCILLTDTACSNLAHSVPDLETLELAGIGEELDDDGLVRLLSTTPKIRRIDLEDASQITDAVLAAITPSEVPEEGVAEPGAALEHVVISYATNVSDNAMLALIRRCPRLRVLEADNTQMGTSVMKEFVQLSRKRSMLNAKIVAVDCRGINEPAVRELISMTRPRLGWRAYSARKLKYLDGKDGDLEDLKAGGQDECDEKRVVLKSFYSWQSVDNVIAARDKRHKRRRANDSESSTDSQTSKAVTMRWWTPGGRRSGSVSPTGETNNEGCRIM